MVVAEVELPQELEVLELPGAENRVEVVAEKVVAEQDDLDRVLHAVEQPLGQPPDLVVRKIGGFEWNVAGREQLSAEGLKPGLLLAELLDVEPVRQDWKVWKDGSVAVDLGGVDLVEAAEAGEVQGRVKFRAGDF